MDSFLVRFSCGVWTARKLDKPATRQAKDHAGAKDKAGVKVYKTVLAAEALEKIQKIANAARLEHQRRTVPWAYNGPGAITAEGYPAYKTAMLGYEQQFNTAVNAFYNIYEKARQEAPQYLGAMYDPADYPTIDMLRSKFHFGFHAEPMPQAQDFRVTGLPQDIVEEIQMDIANNHAAAVDNANVTAWQRVIEKVEMLKQRLTEYNSGDVTKFYDSWTDNVKELADMIPSINIANDPELKRMGQKLRMLTVYSNEKLKNSAGLRSEIVQQATNILAGIDAAYRQAA